MGVTFEQLYHLNLGSLDNAIEAWDATASKLGGIENDYDRDVRTPYRAAGWVSSDGTSQVADRMCRDIAAEITDAHGVAKAIKETLSQARHQLHAQQRALRDLVEIDAPKQHLKVSPTGRVSTQDQDAEADGQAQGEAQARVDAFAERITKILGEAAGADEEAKRALLFDIGSADSGFRSHAAASNSGANEPHFLQPASFNKGPIPLAPGPVPTIKQGHPPQRLRELTGILSFRPYIEGFKLITKQRYADGLSYMWEGVPPTAVGYGAGKAEKFSPGRHRKPSFVNKAGKFGARALGTPLGLAFTAFDYSTNMTGKEKFFDW